MTIFKASSTKLRKKNLFLLLLILPVAAGAAGMGISLPISVTETEKLDYSDFNGDKYHFDYRPSTGLGFVIDTNIGQNRTFNYRFNFEYSMAEIDTAERLVEPDLTKHKYNLVNTFGFGVLQARAVRIWVGPRLNVQYEYASGSSNIRNQYSYGIGLAAAGGINVILGRTVALAADVGYHGALLFGSEKYRDINDVAHTSGYVGTNKGLTARLYLLFRFGEHFEERTEESAEDAVIDHTL